MQIKCPKRHEMKTYIEFIRILFSKGGGISLKNDTYGEPEIIKKNNIVAKVYSPILSDEEREKRMQRIKQAAIRLVLSAETTKG